MRLAESLKRIRRRLSAASVLFAYTTVLLFLFAAPVLSAASVTIEKNELNLLPLAPQICGLNVKVYGTSNQAMVTVTVDHTAAHMLNVTARGYSFTIDSEKLSTGWHTIQVSSGNLSCVEYLHVIGDGMPPVLMPSACVAAGQKALNTICHSYQERLLTEYSPAGNYFNPENAPAPASQKLDDTGIPVYPSPGKYDMVLIENYALHLYDAVLRGESNASFLNLASWLVNDMGPDGALRNNFDFSNGDGISVKSGWVSGMAQGEALSVFSRAYRLTGDDQYIVAGQKAFHFMNVPVADGGTKTTLKAFTDVSPLLAPYANDFLYDEYTSQPEPFVLNGDMFALIGVYDWSQLSSVAPANESFTEAAEDFAAGCQSIAVLVPYYDCDGYSCYDLTPYTFRPSAGQEPNFGSEYAHGCHVALLSALYQITGQDIFNEYKTIFQNDYDQRSA